MDNHCVIRHMERSDLDRVFSWRNRPGVRQYMLTPHQISFDEHTSWFERNSIDPTRKLLIVESGDNSLGFVHFKGVEPGGIGEWGFYTVPGAKKGTGSVLGVCALDYAFRTLALYKVFGQVLAFNKASIGLHNKLGFRQEGVLRKQHRIGIEYHDLICFGLLREEWQLRI